MDQLRAMRVFARVVDDGSFAQAARSLDMAPPVVTRLLAELEQHLGARLLNRTTRRLSLTEVGEQYLDKVRSILAGVDEAAELAADATRLPRGHLRLLCPPAIAVHQLSKHLPRFQAQFPQVTLEITSPGPVETVDEGYDLTIFTSREPPDGDFVARRLARTEVVVCAAPEYLDRLGRPEHPRDLVHHEAIVPPLSILQRGLQFYTGPWGDDEPGGESFTLTTSRHPALSTTHIDTMYAAALAGLGNSPFHPADFTILNKRVSAPRLGHAFSVHGISGNLGWAVAPLVLIGMSEAAGSWRVAYLGCALLAGAVGLTMWLNRGLLDDRLGEAVRSQTAAALPAATPEHPMAFLKLPSVWMCFSFFFWTTAALSAILSFAGPALARMHAVPLSATAFVVTGYMLCAAAGMVAGGYLLARTQRLERSIALAMGASALLLLVVAADVLPALAASALAALAGFGTGLAGPSRDMLVKRAAPPGATGRVYGTVYSGLDAGFALAAPVFGWMLDRGHPQAVFAGAAISLMLGVACAGLVGWRARSQARLLTA